MVAKIFKIYNRLALKMYIKHNDLCKRQFVC